MTTALEGRVPEDSLAHRLVLVRLEMGWTQREAAEACSLTFGEWQSMEAGRRARGLDAKIRSIAAATGYSPIWLMWGGPLGQTSPDGGGKQDLRSDTPGIEHTPSYIASCGKMKRSATPTRSVSAHAPAAA